MKTLSSTQMEELFKILQKNKCEYTINNNGVFLNLSWVEGSILDKMELFINFCNESKKELDKYEQICRDLGDDLIEMKNHEPLAEAIDEEALDEEDPTEETETEEGVKKIVPKISSSMRFYLLKKKFSKSVPSNMQHLKDRLLYKEEYPLLV